MSFPEVFTWIFDRWLTTIKYTIEIHNNTGDLISVLGNAHGISYDESINAAPTLRFTIPADDDKESFIIKANEIWLMNYETNTCLNKFRMSRRVDGRANIIFTTVEADGLLNQLADEQHVADYEASSQTVTQIVTALLALQVISPNITIGTIAPTNTVSMKASTGVTLLRTLYKLRDMVGGYLYVDNSRVLQWASTLGADTGQQVRYQKNLIGIKRSIDYTTIGNRIYAFGSGSGDARIKLSEAAGSPPDYVEDATSQSDWAGIYVKVLVDRTFTDADALLLWANERLADIKEPLITYTVDTSDLAEATEGGFEFEPITLGSTIQVIDEDLGLDISVHVVKMTHPDLLRPQNVRMEVTNLSATNPRIRTRDIIDVISETREIVETEEKLPPSPTEFSSINVIIDGGNAVITTGVKAYIPMPFAGEIISNEMEADQSGSIVVDVWNDTYANFPPTDADSITASAPPTISGATKSRDITLTGWTTTFSAGDILGFNVDSISTIERATLSLKVRRT